MLFADVELRRTDQPERLTMLGLKLIPKGRKLAFGQPCSCFDGQWCRIYPDRPVRCRTFECRVLKRVQEGELTTASALKMIEQVRKQARMARDLMRRLGHTEERVALSRRFAQIMARPIELAEDEMVETRANLMLAVDQLMKCLYRDFLT